jgi:hypothetical protein
MIMLIIYRLGKVGSCKEFVKNRVLDGRRRAFFYGHDAVSVAVRLAGGSDLQNACAGKPDCYRVKA